MLPEEKKCSKLGKNAPNWENLHKTGKTCFKLGKLNEIEFLRRAADAKTLLDETAERRPWYFVFLIKDFDFYCGLLLDF